MKETSQQILSSALFSLSHAGYTYTSAIMDIIDNSAEKYVNSSRISLSTQSNGSQLLKIIIADNGIGMDIETLEQAIYIGSRTGKSAENNLGMYGMGLKTAAMSLGYKLEVYTKREDANRVLYGSWDIPRTKDTDSNGRVFIEEVNDARATDIFLRYTHEDHGTVVIISDLKNVRNVKPKDFSKNMLRNVGIYFNKFIHEGHIKFYVNGAKVPYIDLIGENIGQDVVLMGSGLIEVGGKEIKYKAWNIPVFADDENDSGETNFIPRTLSNQGIYIYRQNRLVGNALTLGLFSRRTAINGFRVELFMDGTCDELFCSSFTKVIQEKKREDIDPELFNKLRDTLGEYWIRVEKEYKSEINKKKVNDPDTLDFFAKVCASLNNDPNINVNKRIRKQQEDIERKKRENNKENKTDNNKQQNDKQPKESRPEQINKDDIYESAIKGCSWIHYMGLEESKDSGLIRIVQFNASQVDIYINMLHPYYENVFAKIPENIRFIMAKGFASIELARRDAKYYDNEQSLCIIDTYERALYKQMYTVAKINKEEFN
jgi:hypothetical protein